MPPESKELSQARRHLSQVEADLLGPDAEYHLIEGLDLLEAIAAENTADARTATNLGSTYLSALQHRIDAALAPRDITEPALKRLLRLAQALAQSVFADGSDIGALTTRIAHRFMDALLEGYSPEEKEREIRKALARLQKGGS